MADLASEGERLGYLQWTVVMAALYKIGTREEADVIMPLWIMLIKFRRLIGIHSSYLLGWANIYSLHNCLDQPCDYVPKTKFV